MNKQIEFNIRTLNNKQNGGGYFDGNKGLRAKDIYRMVKGYQSIHDKDLGQVLQAKEIKARNTHQTIQLICDQNVQAGVKGQFDLIDQNMGNSQYLEVATPNRGEDAVSGPAQSQANVRGLSNNGAGHPWAHQSDMNLSKVHHDIVNIVCNQEGQVSSIQQSPRSNGASPRIATSRTPINHGSAAKSKNATNEQRVAEYSSKQLQMEVIAGQAGKRKQSIVASLQMRQRTSEMSQSLQMLDNGNGGPVLAPLKQSGNVVHGSNYSSKQESATNASQKMRDNGFENSIDFVRLIQNREEASQDNQKSVYFDPRRSPPFDRKPGPTEAPRPPTESEQAFMAAERLKLEKFSERIQQKKYTTPYELIKHEAPAPAENGQPRTKPSVIKANLNKFEDQILRDSNALRMVSYGDCGAQDIETLIITNGRSQSPDIDSSPTLILSNKSSPYQHSKVRFQQLSDKHIYNEFHMISADIYGSIGNGNNIIEQRSSNNPQTLQSALDHTTDHAAIPKSQMNANQKEDIANSLLPVVSVGKALRGRNIEVNQETTQNTLLIQDKQEAQVLPGHLDGTRDTTADNNRMQNESTVSKASINAFNQQRLQSPRYLDDTMPPIGLPDTSPQTIGSAQGSKGVRSHRSRNVSIDKGEAGAGHSKSRSPVDDKGGQKKTKIAITSKDMSKAGSQLPELTNTQTSGSIMEASSAEQQDLVNLNMRDYALAKEFMRAQNLHQKSIEVRDQLVMNPRWIGWDNEIQDELTIASPNARNSRLGNNDKLNDALAIDYNKRICHGFGVGKPQIGDPVIPSNSGGFQSHRQSLKDKKKVINAKVKPELEKQMHKMAKNQLNSVFNDTISPRLPQAFHNSIRNSVEADLQGRIKTKVFGLQDESQNRHKFISMSIDSCDVNKSVYNHSQITDRLSLRNTCANFNGSTYTKSNTKGKYEGPQFCQSVHLGKSIMSDGQSSASPGKPPPAADTQWAQLTAKCNINSYSKKTDERWTDYVPNKTRNFNTDNSVKNQVFDGSLENLQHYFNIRNINTCENNQGRKNAKAGNAINYQIQRRLIMSQEGEVATHEDSKLQRHSLLPEFQALAQKQQNHTSEASQRPGRGAATITVSKDSTIPSQTIKNQRAHETFLQSLSQTASIKQKGALKPIRKLHSLTKTENKYEINIKQKTLDFKEKHIQSTYLDEMKDPSSPHQTYTNSMFIQKIQSRDSTQTKDLNAKRDKMNNKDLVTHVRKQQVKKARASVATDGGVTYQVRAQQKGIKNDKGWQNIDTGSSNRSDQKNLDHQGTMPAGHVLNEIDEKSQVNEMTTSDIVSNFKPDSPAKTRVFSRDNVSRERRSFKGKTRMSFEEVDIETLNPKNKNPYQEALTTFDEFSVIKNAEKMKHSSATYGTHGNTHTLNNATTENTFCLKESSMQTCHQAFKYLNNDLHNNKTMQGKFKNNNDQLMTIRASPMRTHNDTPLTPTAMHSQVPSLLLDHTGNSYYPRRDKIKIQIAKLGNIQTNQITGLRYKDSRQRKCKRFYVEPQHNGLPMPIAGNLQIVPSQVILSSTSRNTGLNFQQFDQFSPNTLCTSKQSPRQGHSKAGQLQSMMAPKKSPVAYIGKKKLYENPNVFFQLNPREIQGRICNLGENYAQKILNNKASPQGRASPRGSPRGDQHSRRQSPYQQLADSAPSFPLDSARSGQQTFRTMNEVKNNDLNFIDFNCLEVVGQVKKTQNIQQRTKKPRRGGRPQIQVSISQGSRGEINQRDIQMGNSMVTSFNSTQKASALKDSALLDEAGLAAIQSGFEFVGDTNPRYNGKVVISSAQKNLWQGH